MDDLPAAPALLVYPALWRRAAERHPRGPGYDPAAHFRHLQAICADYRRDPSVPLGVLSEGERTLFWALATLGADTEAFILGCVAKYPDDPLGWLDPSDPYVARPTTRSAEGG